jgi:transcriptional regulator EpsA
MTDVQQAEEDSLDSTALPARKARALLRFVEDAPAVCRRHHFYLLLQSHLEQLVPHTLALCGAYERQRKLLAFDLFNTVPLPPLLQLQLRRTDSPLLMQVQHAWVDGRGEPLVMRLERRPGLPPDTEVAALLELGVQRLLVHGVSRPGRVNEVSSMFLFGGPAPAADDNAHMMLRLVINDLHAAYVRVLTVERETGQAAPQKGGREDAVAAPTMKVTPREAQILCWVRDGKNNQEIGLALGISALTVKNHVQKILRKLGASNRAHAVALALQLRLLDDAHVR